MNSERSKNLDPHEMADDGDIDFVCSVCGYGWMLYARPRYCLLCTHYALSETMSEAPEAPRKQRGVKRIRTDITDDKEHAKRYIEFNENKRAIDKKIIGSDLSIEEYDAFIKSWVNIQ